MYRALENIPSSGAAGRTYIMQFASNIIRRRKDSRSRGLSDGIFKQCDGTILEDFLTKIMRMKDDDKRGVTDYDVTALCLSNIIAGSDTTGTSLSGILYHLIRTPRAMKKLREELATVPTNVSFAVAQEMKYLQACIKEGLRLHVAVGLPLFREVVGNGAEISGQSFPPGSEVGLSVWAAHYDEVVWGKDVNEFRPGKSPRCKVVLWLRNILDMLCLSKGPFLLTLFRNKLTLYLNICRKMD